MCQSYSIPIKPNKFQTVLDHNVLLGIFMLASAASPRCSEQYLSPGSSAASHEYINLPAVSGVVAISLWVWVEGEQDEFSWDYLFDARPHLPGGWFAFSPFPQLNVGSQWVRLIDHDFGNASQAAPGAIPFVRRLNGSLTGESITPDHWHHLYVESSTNFSGDVHLLSRYEVNEAGIGEEDLHAKVPQIPHLPRP